MSLGSFARLSDVDVLITDDALPDDARGAAAEHIHKVIYAEDIGRPLQQAVLSPG